VVNRGQKWGTRYLVRERTTGEAGVAHSVDFVLCHLPAVRVFGYGSGSGMQELSVPPGLIQIEF
jgi:hypothetical protein